MIHLHLTTSQNAYDVVGDIIDKEAEKVFGNYNPCAFIVKLGYKYDSESENERVIENEYYYNNGIDCYWENDWHEGQTDIIIYGFTAMEEVDVKHEITGETE